MNIIKCDIYLLIFAIIVCFLYILGIKNKEYFDVSTPIGNEAVQNLSSVITGNDTIPSGTIYAYNKGTIPTGWVICDGTNGTPDLRGRFILGSGNGPGLTNRILNGKGGSEITAFEAKEKSRGPKMTLPYLDVSSSSFRETRYVYHTPAAWENNMPPYHVLFFIMKL